MGQCQKVRKQSGTPAFHSVILIFHSEEQQKAINERDVITEDRIEKANALYALLVKYAESGREIWYDNNEAKYNDYVIYDTPNGEAPGDEPPVGT